MVMVRCKTLFKLYDGKGGIMPDENLGPSTVAPPNNISDKDKAKLEAKVKREKAKREKKEKKKPKPPKVKSNIDLGPIECVCPNCRQKHDICFSPGGESISITQNKKKMSTGTGNRSYRCPCCHLNLPMRKPVVKKENEDEKTDPC
jgi:nitrate reductase cytochrome c-type subunit